MGSYSAFNGETQRTDIRVWVDRGPTDLPIVKVTLQAGDKKSMLTLSTLQADILADKVDEVLRELEDLEAAKKKARKS